VSRFLIRIKPFVSSCLRLLQRSLLKWTKPPQTSLLLGTFTDLARGKSELVAENALLRQQLIILRRQIKRPRYTPTDRILLVLLARAGRDLETSPLDCSARNASHMASSAVPPLLEAPFQAKTDTGESSSRDHCVDQGDGKQQSTLGSGTSTGRITQVGDSCQPAARSRSTCDPCAHLDQEDRTGGPSSATTLRVPGPVIFYRSLISSFGRSLPSSSSNCNHGR
jgi:hypothetical protein